MAAELAEILIREWKELVEINIGSFDLFENPTPVSKEDLEWILDHTDPAQELDYYINEMLIDDNRESTWYDELWAEFVSNVSEEYDVTNYDLSSMVIDRGHTTIMFDHMAQIIFSDIYNSKINDNTPQLFDYDILVTNIKSLHYHSLTTNHLYITTETVDKDDEYQRFIETAINLGFTEDDIATVLNNCHLVNATGIFGIVINAGDLIAAIQNNREHIVGSDIVMAVWNWCEGNGFCVRKECTPPKFLEYQIRYISIEDTNSNGIVQVCKLW